jgi:PRTRC genetic system protein C
MARKSTTAPATGATAPENIVPVGRVRRIFTHGAQRLQDPDPTMTAMNAKKVLAATYPELATATLTLTKTEDGANGAKTEHWEFRRSVGTKG